jgi:hypothetical protein
MHLSSNILKRMRNTNTNAIECTYTLPYSSATMICNVTLYTVTSSVQAYSLYKTHTLTLQAYGLRLFRYCLYL